jgi:hypothetical protein
MSESTETALKEPSSSEGNAEKTGFEKIVEAGSIDKLEEVVKTGNPKHWNENKFNAVVRYFLGSLLLVGLSTWCFGTLGIAPLPDSVFELCNIFEV